MSEHTPSSVTSALRPIDNETNLINACESMLSGLIHWLRWEHDYDCPLPSTVAKQMMAAQSMLAAAVSKATGKPCNPADYDQNPGQR